MSNGGAIVRFCTTAIITTAFLIYSTLNGLSFNGDTFYTQTAIQVNLKNDLPTIYSINTTQSEIKVDEQSADKSQSEASVSVSTGGTIQGKVVEKFISPYTANTSYNSVYLKNNTDLNINLKEFLNANLGYNIEKNNEPQVLILHTHATESYLREEKTTYTDKDTARTRDNEYNMVALGKIISDKLNEAGIKTLHDTTQHDYPSYNQSYSRAAQTICNYTEKHKSIKVVIDLHRDAIAQGDTDKVKLTTEINGKKAAQIMLVMGSQSGSIKNHPNWKENLKLATKIQQTVEVMYPTLARSIHFMSKNYNQSLSRGAVLIEIGTDGNTIQEAKYSAELLSNALISLFNTL